MNHKQIKEMNLKKKSFVKKDRETLKDSLICWEVPFSSESTLNVKRNDSLIKKLKNLGIENKENLNDS